MREGWEYKRLGELCDIVMGQSPMGNSINENNGIEFHQGKTNFGDKFLMESGIYTTSPIRIAEKKTILLCVRAPVGIINITERQVCIGRGLSSLKPRLGLELLYLYYCLLSKQNYFESNSTGSTFKAISSKVINNTIIQFPPKPTQLSIVSELDKLNELIQIKKEQLKDYDVLAQSIFYEMFGDPVENEKGWEVKKLMEICDVRDGTHDSPKYVESSNYMLITSKNIVNRAISFDDVNYITEEDYNNINKRSKVDDGDIIMPMIGTIGNPVIVYLDNLHKFSIKNVALIKFFHNTSILNRYLLELMISDSFRKYLLSLNKGGTQKFVALGTIRRMDIILPPLPLQQSFAHKIEQIERQKATVQSTITELETLVAARMQYWFD